jgi:hypothetical protein
MKSKPIMKYVRPLTVVAALGFGAIAFSAASDHNNGEHDPLGQILTSLREQAAELAAIKAQLQAIQGTLAPPASLRLSTGSFGLPRNAMSVDWEVINNSTVTQTVTVTVFRVPGAGPKTIAPPGPLTVTIAPGEALHNANSVGPGLPFEPGFDYEVVLDTSSPNVLPRLDMWEDFGNTVIPGTLIPAGSWVSMK